MVLYLKSEYMFGKYVRYKTEEGNEMTNTASTTHRTGKKESRKLFQNNGSNSGTDRNTGGNDRRWDDL